MTERFTVYGKVRDADSWEPLSGAVVHAYDKDLPSLRSDQFLGRAITGSDGEYNVEFQREGFRAYERGGAELYVLVFADEEGKQLLGSASARIDGETETRIDVLVATPDTSNLSEYDRLHATLSPLLGRISLADLTGEDIRFLAEEGPEELTYVAWLAAAHRLMVRTGVPAEAFYGWARSHPPVPDAWQDVASTDPGKWRALLRRLLELLVATPVQELREALYRAVGDQIIPDSFGALVDETVEDLIRWSYTPHSLLGRLRDADTGLPVPGMSVRVSDLEAGVQPMVTGHEVTGGDGIFPIRFAVPPDRERVQDGREAAGRGAPAHRALRISASTVDREEFWSVDIQVATDQDSVLTFDVPLPQAPQPAEHALSQLVPAVGLQLPDELASFLDNHSIHTLNDIRKLGGLAQTPGLPVATHHPAVRLLDAHADLSLLSPDVGVHAALIDRGFFSVADIAAASRPEFVAQLGEKVGDFQAAHLQTVASARTSLLKHVLGKLALDQANGWPSEPATTTPGPAPDPLPKNCGCADCEAAVSPAAYLADLVAYAATRLRSNGGKVTLDFLEDTFHQRFGDLPTDCASVDTQVRQVRLAVEVLRLYAAAHPPATPEAEKLGRDTERYLLELYTRLLTRFGTSYEEMRLARTASPEARRAVADRLGIALTQPRPDPQTTDGDELDQLFLNGVSTATNPATLTEQAVERLFGVVDTTRDPLCDGTKTGDDAGSPELLRWRFQGVRWPTNTDAHGLLHLRVTSTLTPRTTTVEVYRDSGRTELVARGEVFMPVGGVARVRLLPENGSGLSGDVTVAGSTTDNSGISLAMLPKMLLWRLGGLRELWRREDGAVDPYSPAYAPAAERRAVVDPDVIGPDDFRRPESAEPAFALWTARRKWIDQLLATLAAPTKVVTVEGSTVTVPDAEAVLAGMYLAVTYGSSVRKPWRSATPLDELDALGEVLESGTVPDVKAAGERVTDDLNLTVDAFRQVLRTRDKARAWEADPKLDKVQPEEWAAFFSILARAQKDRFTGDWVAEEDAKAIRLGPETFWRCLREPREGAWPPVRVTGRPLIDPEQVKSVDLPEPRAGEDALALWQARRDELAAATAAIKAARETSGFDAMLRKAIDHPAPGDPPGYPLETLSADLADEDPDVVAQAVADIENDLHLTVDSFRRIVALKQQAGPASPHKPTPEEWAELYAVLTTAYKVGKLHALWAAAEDAAGLSTEYWRALKARLPRARASVEVRHEWTYALGLRCAAPVIDPDLVDVTVFRGSGVQAALKLWQQRRTWVDGELAGLGALPKTLAGFDTAVTEKLSVPALDLVALQAAHEQGASIQDRLDQLPLSRPAFTFLLKVRQLLAAGEHVADTEWESVHTILLGATKSQRAGEWREQERIAGVTLSPDVFVPPPDPSAVPPVTLPTHLQAKHRLVGERHHAEWLDTLRSRAQQELDLLSAFHETVDEVEEAVLPTLRDALTEAVGVGGDLAAKSAWVTERLLVEGAAGGCQKTTRIAQAMESLQSLLFAARTKHAALQPLGLTLDAPEFDQEWRWIGSYATWRSAMFVFMYPENVAVGSLRRHQSPAFRELIKALRSNRRLTPDDACRLAGEYAAYYEDIAKLAIGATTQAKLRVNSGTVCTPGHVAYQPLVFMFGNGGVSGRLYWSTFDPTGDTAEYAQAFWEQVPGAPGGCTVVGATVYERSFGDRRLFLFVRTSDHKLQFLVLDLETGSWSAPADLALPSGDARWFECVIDQSNDTRYAPQLAIKAYGDFFIRRMNPEGTAWEDGDWQKFRLDPKMWYLSGERSLLAATEGTIWVRTDQLLTQRARYTAVNMDPATKNGTYVGVVLWGKAKNYFTGHLVQELPNGSVHALPAAIGEGFQLDGVKRIAPNCGFLDHSAYAYERRNRLKLIGKAGSASRSNAPASERDGVYLRLVTLETTLSDERVVTASHLIAPRASSYLKGQFTIPARLDDAAAKVRRSMVKSALYLQDDSATHRTVAEEAYFFVPMALSDALRRSGEYVAALEFARTVYDYTAPAEQRKIYHGLVEEESLPAALKRGADWLRDPLDPHAVAAYRQLAYTRYTQQAIARTLLDFADEEFTRDTAETVPRARSLYTRALSVLDLPELKQTVGSCSDVIGKIHVGLGSGVPSWGIITLNELGVDLGRLNDFDTLSSVVTRVRAVLKSDAPWDERVARARVLVSRAVAEEAPRATVADSVRRKTEVDARALASLLASPAISRAAEQAGAAAGTRFLNAVACTAGVKPAVVQTGELSLPWLHETVTAASTADDLAFTPDLWPIGTQSGGAAAGLLFPDHLPDIDIDIDIDDDEDQPIYIPDDWWRPPPPSPVGVALTPSVAFCVPPNPVLAALRLHAEVNLHKIRTCRNIAGMKRALDPYAAPTDTVSGLPTIGSGGQLVTPGTHGVRPTLYRYGVLVQRAKELVVSAQQIEAAMLSAFEKRDAEAYSMLRANQDLELAQTGVQLENLRLKYAHDSVTLATLQQDRARIQADHFQELLDEGLLELESVALAQMQEAVSYLGTAADFSFAAAAVQGAAAVAGAVAGGIVGSAAGPLGTALGAGGGALVGALSGGLGGVAAGLSAVSSGYSSLAGEYSTLAQIKLTAAGFERRRQDWDLALALAQQDMAIGEQQVTLANDQVDIAKQEKLIAETRNTHAKDIVTFLANKFTNVDLYDWMGDVLEEVYDTLLQQATSIARLAENQLAFERQEPPPTFIQSDYWQAPEAGSASADLDGTAADRRGLTGSARLLQDLSRLDHYAFTSDRRKLQLSKTFSLSMTAPTEFQRFRETGVLRFATPMRAFNEDFPGHYLRLIKNVRASVVALVPPTHGIHAELSTTGLSRVVIGPDVFQTVPIRRDPEVIALSAPVGSNEIVSLEAQSLGMLLPFEGTGVDAVWELRMPKAANLPVDYRAIADVLFSVDFTALPSWEHGKQVVESLRGSVGAELPVSMRLQLPDQWYDLHNPDTTSEPMLVRFRIGREDFPANIDALKIQHVALRFGVRDGTPPFEAPVTLRFTEKDSPVTSGGTAKPVEGIISTRRGNAGSWMSSFTGRKPVGEWELSLPDTEAVRARFVAGDMDDVLLVVSYSGRPPDWPE
ncbi:MULTISPECIES: neuraminidase-like domain-containing protein [unclassified Streptomyces]|uniref:Tc toxin subunit A-related protein n=1 Tax=unclassified Streptomyces TaxID=2593676 RepID=UPI0025B3EC47|nr:MULTISPECIES: neuraminidase-like domain-containing protein [unclassified Streptomyces]MDN3249779.1 hypothetical protein [Streptomyces sp. ZSW22]MDN3258044.1 hypothetical protein [Streptomyces sp. MA25(2023)]